MLEYRFRRFVAFNLFQIAARVLPRACHGFIYYFAVGDKLLKCEVEREAQ